MGYDQSTTTTAEIKDLPRIEEGPPGSAGGRKESAVVLVEEPHLISIDSLEETDSLESANDEGYESEDVSEDEEEDEEWNERLNILRDARKLRRVAGFYLCPEKAVETDGFCSGRNYFTRFEAPISESSDEHAQILADVAALRQLATDYLCPDRPVVTSDPNACGRNYFSRPSANGHEDVTFSSEVDRILEDMKQMKKLAVDYLHPEVPVKVSNPYACGRNYFSRPSAVPYEDDDEAQEREQVFADAAALKTLAVDYLHPEIPVKTSDPNACGRNYFARASAITTKEAAAHEQVLEDIASLKKLAVDYLHPEIPVKVSDPSACGRNYYDRASAPGHNEQIQTMGYSLSNAADHNQDGYYHYQIDNRFHHDHHEQSDHFEMDEDMATEFQGFRQSFQAVAAPIKNAKIPFEEEEGRLSRSPSSVMLDLFDEPVM